MSIESLKNQLPDSAKDIKLNLSSVLKTEDGAPDLTPTQIAGIALASAFATKNAAVVGAIRAEFQEELTTAVLQAAESSSIIMAMNNIYYRFIHLVNDAAFANLPAKLRMNVIGNPGIPHADFELNCLAVSAINGCGLCIESHTHSLAKAGISKLGVQSCIRVAAVVHAAAQGITIQSL